MAGAKSIKRKASRFCTARPFFIPVSLLLQSLTHFIRLIDHQRGQDFAGLSARPFRALGYVGDFRPMSHATGQWVVPQCILRIFTRVAYKGAAGPFSDTFEALQCDFQFRHFFWF
jgi:hypothetical protein